MYKAGMCKRSAALLEYWFQQQTRQQQCVNNLSRYTGTVCCITSPSDLQHIHTFKGGAESV